MAQRLGTGMTCPDACTYCYSNEAEASPCKTLVTFERLMDSYSFRSLRGIRIKGPALEALVRAMEGGGT
ncbi:MAG: uncharacterized protein KVP18_001376 [Porospora cf. gigantea A]|uniref:uncharacterized protein n=1 Tax=Porospora cf. gigantea A TaxID=2853593 RepID=UPI00355AC8C7|nr:MAG: hypothetical protein KVP18_001376 [Porospora cf. gigantea A]